MRSQHRRSARYDCESLHKSSDGICVRFSPADLAGIPFLAVPRSRRLAGHCLCLNGTDDLPLVATALSLDHTLVRLCPFSKFTLIAVPSAIILDLLLQRQFKSAARFGISLLLLCGAVFAVAEKASGAFAFHVFSPVSDTYSVAQFFGLMGLVWLSAPVVTALAGFHVLTKIWSRRLDMPTIYFLIATLTSFTAGKAGATTNHFLEWMIAACLCAALAYDRIRRDFPARLPAVAVMLGISILIAATVQSYRLAKTDPELAGCQNVYGFLAKSGSVHVLSQSLGPLLLTGKPVVLTDPFAYGQLVRHNIVSDAPLVDAINSSYFDIILLGSDPNSLRADEPSIWPSRVLDGIRKHYKATKRFGCRDGSVFLEPES